jgi:hypothetical protein
MNPNTSKDLERSVTIGSNISMRSISPSDEFAVIFEDDGVSAHFYAALNTNRNDRQILDVVNIYTVEHVSDIKSPCNVHIRWSEDALKVILLIDGYPHAVFDFQQKRGYCRTNYPNVSRNGNASWDSEDHKWQDSALQWFH